MKTFKKTLFMLMCCTFTSAMLLTGCKKKEEPPLPASANKPDDASGSAEADAALDDVNDIINNRIGGGANQGDAGGRVATYNLPCGIIKFDSAQTNTAGNKIYTLQYGANSPCGYKYKSGEVSFELQQGNKYSDTGAVYKVTFTNYKVEVRATGREITINGYKVITNLTGGYVWQAVTQGHSIAHSVRGNITLTYTDNTQRERKFFKKRTWTSNDSWAGLTFSVDGDTLIENQKISETGTTYEGNRSYKNVISTPFSWSNCGSTWAGPYVLKTGEARMIVAVPDITQAYFNLEAGYYQDLTNLSSTPEKKNDCSSNAYKITTVIGNATNTAYQLY